MQTSHKQSSPKLGCYQARKEMEKAADMLFGLWAGRLIAPRQIDQELLSHPSCPRCCSRAMGLVSIPYYFCSETTHVIFYKGTSMLSILAFLFGHLLGVSLMTSAWNDPFGSFLLFFLTIAWDFPPCWPQLSRLCLQGCLCESDRDITVVGNTTVKNFFVSLQ